MRRRLLIGGGVALGLLLAGLFTVWLSYGRIGEYVVREKLLPRVRAKLGRDVAVDSIEVGRGTVFLRGLTVPSQEGDPEPLLYVEEVKATFDYGASWKGDAIVHDVEMRGLKAYVTRHADGSNNVADILARLRGSDEALEEERESGRSGLRPRSVKVVDGTAELFDHVTGARFQVEGLGASADQSDEADFTLGEIRMQRRGAGPKVSFGHVSVTVNLNNPLASARADVGRGEISMWQGMSLTGIQGTIEQGKSAGQLIVDVTGSYGGSDETLWYANGWLEPMARQGQLTVKADSFTFDRIAPVLEGTIVEDFDDTSIDAELLVELRDGVASFSGLLNLSNLTVHHPMLSLEPLRDVSFQADLAATFDSGARLLRVDALKVTSKSVPYRLEGEVALEGGLEADGSRRLYRRLRVHGSVPKTHCQKVLDSIPAGFVPKLQGFELDGPFEADLTLEVDWSDLKEATVLDGFVGLPDCGIVEPNEEFDAERLTNSFEHQILVGAEEFETVAIGLESENYAQIFDISSYFLNAVLTQEDSRFYDHEGFITREFRSALVRNLEAGHFKFGASSITMQMVKNVFLYRDKTISRKVQELFLTWYVEQTLEKNRILEIYVNAIEYGPGVYGIVKAANIYFGKHPREINPVEAAWLTQLLPSPRRRYFQYCRGDKLSRRTRNKIGRILANMNKRDRLTDSELEMADPTSIEFNPQKVRELCKERPDW